MAKQKVVYREPYVKIKDIRYRVINEYALESEDGQNVIVDGKFYTYNPSSKEYNTTDITRPIETVPLSYMYVERRCHSCGQLIIRQKYSKFIYCNYWCKSSFKLKININNEAKLQSVMKLKELQGNHGAI